MYKDFLFRATEARIAETAKLLNMFQVLDEAEHVAALQLMGLNSDIRLLEAQLAASRKKNGGEDVEPEAGTPETVDAGAVE